MERWNGWGDPDHDVALPAALPGLLLHELGPGTPPQDALLADVLGAAPPPRLPAGDGFSTDALDRVLHARGQSFPDLVALRSGQLGTLPDAVAHPSSAAEVRALLERASAAGAVVVPYGGGTSVVGGISAPPGDAPVLTVDVRRMQQLHALDEHSRLATFGAGVAGPQVEARLRAHGHTLGHYPQSFERSTLGGWVATRSSGQQSLGFGRIEDLFAGGRLEAPAGTLELQPFPASAAGPDLRQAVLGSEGRLGILTDVTVRVRRLPEADVVAGAFLPSWDSAVTVARTLVQDGTPLSMVRLSTPAETAASLLMGGRAGRAMAAALDLRRLGGQRCLLLFGVTGGAGTVRSARRHVTHVVRAAGGVGAGTPIGRSWQRGRFSAPYLRNHLWERGYGVDTVETAAVWSSVPGLVERLEAALHGALEERVHVGTHLSHVYRSGSSVYTTFVFRLCPDPAETLQRWARLKAAALRAIAEGGGTLSHQHGVGLDHRDALPAEKGPLGMAALAALTTAFDPAGLLNPGKLLR
ncbi:alkyldihydroxyacetonephosphate synthase [Kineococcus xinjiangensis]|uniref:Alkyldihydroxyacetonephosphate synthase n=1 Tax=Kineococcus xinjiangensis TaxID=512762 RepID=A0A2S6IPE3_9ACTN|nr:FAD-binding oxidoreductase [Kineococcus xinjiangensis]PPK96113.1 alkyldihydroxyacetonephosphate synthase [Kineococcus xinjiangensis]